MDVCPRVYLIILPPAKFCVCKNVAPVGFVCLFVLLTSFVEYIWIIFCVKKIHKYCGRKQIIGPREKQISVVNLKVPFQRSLSKAAFLLAFKKHHATYHCHSPCLWVLLIGENVLQPLNCHCHTQGVSKVTAVVISCLTSKLIIEREVLESLQPDCSGFHWQSDFSDPDGQKAQPRPESESQWFTYMVTVFCASAFSVLSDRMRRNYLTDIFLCLN